MTQHNPLSWSPWPAHSVPWEQFSSSLHPVATGAGAMRTQPGHYNSQSGPSNSQASRHRVPCSQSLYFRPCRKKCQKVCRKFQEAVIGVAGTGQWARHSALGPWGARILNIATKFSSELRTSDQVLLMWPMRGFHDGTPELCQELVTQCQWGLVAEQSSIHLFCVDFSKEPVQHKRLNSKCQKQGEEKWEIKVLPFMFLWIWFGCDWIEGLRLRARE